MSDPESARQPAAVAVPLDQEGSATDWKAQLLAALGRADARIWRGRAEMAAGGDDRAQAIYDAVAACHQTLGGAYGTRRRAVACVADALNVSHKSVDVALAKVNAGLPGRPGLPLDLWDRLVAAELAELPPLPAACWSLLAHIVRGIAFDPLWIENQPGQLLADEVTQVASGSVDTQAVARDLARACAAWPRAAALSVIDVLARCPTLDADEGRSKDGADVLDWARLGLPVNDAAPQPATIEREATTP